MRAQASAPLHWRPCWSTACIQRMAASWSICGNRFCTEGSCRSKNSMRSRVSNGRTRATLTRQRLQAPSYRTVSLVIFQIGPFYLRNDRMPVEVEIPWVALYMSTTLDHSGRQFV